MAWYYDTGTIKNYRFIISALRSAHINDYEKYTKEAFYLLNYLSEMISYLLHFIE